MKRTIAITFVLVLAGTTMASAGEAILCSRALAPLAQMLDITCATREPAPTAQSEHQAIAPSAEDEPIFLGPPDEQPHVRARKGPHASAGDGGR